MPVKQWWQRQLLNVKTADTLVLRIWSLPLSWSVRGLTATWQAWYSSVWSLALHSVRRISISSAGAHRLQTEFLCLLSWLWLQGLSTQHSWSRCWITKGRQGGSCSKGFSDRAPKAVRNTQMDVRTLSQSSLSFLKAAFCRLPPLGPLHSPLASCVCNSKYGSSNRQSGVALVMSTQGEVLLLLSTELSLRLVVGECAYNLSALEPDRRPK